MADSFFTGPFNIKKLEVGERLQAATLDPASRQKLVETLLYPYPLFKEGIAFIEKFHRPVKNGSHSTAKIGGLLGESRVGKSSICKYFCSQNPGFIDEQGEVYPIVYFQSTDDMLPRTMAERIAQATGARSLPTMKIAALMDSCIDRLVRARTELLIIDDAQFMFERRRSDQIRHFKSFLKFAADRGAFNILLVGEQSVQEVIRTTDYLNGRGGFPHKDLRPLKEEGDEFDQFLLLMEGVDNRLPFLSKSNLANDGIAREIHRFSGGLIGRVMNLIQYAAFEAINANTQKIMIEHFQSAADMLVPVNDTHRYFRGR